MHHIFAIGQIQKNTRSRIKCCYDETGAAMAVAVIVAMVAAATMAAAAALAVAEVVAAAEVMAAGFYFLLQPRIVNLPST